MSDFHNFCAMEADEDFWRELLQDGNSDDEQFEGFTVEELAKREDALKKMRRLPG